MLQYLAVSHLKWIIGRVRSHKHSAVTLKLGGHPRLPAARQKYATTCSGVQYKTRKCLAISACGYWPPGHTAQSFVHTVYKHLLLTGHKPAENRPGVSSIGAGIQSESGMQSTTARFIDALGSL